MCEIKSWKSNVHIFNLYSLNEFKSWGSNVHISFFFGMMSNKDRIMLLAYEQIQSEYNTWGCVFGDSISATICGARWQTLSY